MKYLSLIRFPNLVLIALVQISLRYGFILPKIGISGLNDFQFFLLVLATVFIAAAGYIINDIYDVEADKINKPKRQIIGKSISENTGFNLYLALNIVGVGCGFFVSNAIDRPGFVALFIILSASLYLYANTLKRMIVISNLLIAGLVAMSLIVVAIFDLLPLVTPENKEDFFPYLKMTGLYALFAFSINFIREIVKDIQDINGDKKQNINTLPISLGRKRTVIIVFVLTLLLTFGIMRFLYLNLYTEPKKMLYFLFGIVGPLLYFCIKAWDAKKQKDYRILSSILKFVMFTGICSLWLFRF